MTPKLNFVHLKNNFFLSNLSSLFGVNEKRREYIDDH